LIDIVIPAFDSVDLTWRCLTHVFAFPANDMRVILVDDGSSDSTPCVGEFLRRRGHLYIRHEENKGPYAAWNTGWRAGRGGRVLFLNNDVAVFGSTLEHFEDFRGPYACATEVIGKWDPGEMAAYADGIQMSVAGDVSTPGYLHSCFAVDRSLLEKLDGFDEQFYLTFGDTDFMLRAKEVGVEPRVLKAAVVFHGVSVTRRRAFGLERDVNHDLFDREKFEAKWAGRPDLLVEHPRTSRQMMVEDRKVAWKDGEDVG
jgi:GT2 family glycosyltransferase